MIEQFADFRKLVPAVSLNMLFDVGANVGQSTRVFRQACPAAKIFAFEPVRQSFEALKASCGDDATTSCFNLALGDHRGHAAMQASGTKLTNRIVARGQAATDGVEIETGDAFCASQRIAHIDFLKIDTEGYDLKVCAGFSDMLARKRIDLVQVEAGMNPDNVDHVPLQEFVEFFSARSYLIFRLYDQDMRPGRPRLRRANVVFISAAQLALAAKEESAASLSQL